MESVGGRQSVQLLISHERCNCTAGYWGGDGIPQGEVARFVLPRRFGGDRYQRVDMQVVGL